MRKATTDNNMISMEYYPLFYGVIRNASVENDWKNYNNFITYENYKDSLEMLLNAMPVCGSYYIENKGVKSDPLWIKSRVIGHRNKRGTFCETVQSTSIVPNIDYMILFNLYYLLIEDNLPINPDWADFDYPTSYLNPEGSQQSPAYFEDVKFTMSKTVHSDGNLTLTATNEIELLPGFEVEAGGEFEAKIEKDLFMPDCDFNHEEGENPCLEKNVSDSTFIFLKQSECHSAENTELLTTSIDTVSTYKLYPNPASKEVFLNFNNRFLPQKIQIIDFSGKVISEIDKPKNGLKIDISNLNEGLYFFIIIYNNEIYTEKIIKI